LVRCAYRSLMDLEGEGVSRASGILMERYGLTESRAVALLRRLAKHYRVTIGVVALAVIAASRRRAEEDE
jgi:AmiR/NasT family two-component response regulator